MGIIEPLLNIEEKYNLWEAEVEGEKLWPAIRSTTMDTYIRRMLNYHYDFRGRQRPSPSFIKTYRAQHIRTIARLVPFRPVKHASMLFFTLANDGFHEYLYRRVPTPRIVETVNAHSVTEHDWRNAGFQMLLEDTIRALSAGYRKIFKLPTASQKSVREFASHVTTLFDLPTHESQFSVVLANYLAFNRFVKMGIADSLLKNLDTRTVFMREASYLGHLAIWCKWLHQSGFKVVELQHAMIYRDHFAYNYPVSLLHAPNHPARQYFADEFLTFGSYWGTHIRVPYPTTPIGFPRLSENVKLVQQIEPEPRQIVVLSEQLQSLADLTVHLSRLLPNYQIVFKLHPVEALLTNQYPELVGLPNVTVIERCNLYELFAKSSVIIGEATTALFEAFAIGKRRLFVYDNNLIPAEIATRFTSAEMFCALLEDPSTGLSSLPMEEFFAADWEQSIDQFLAQQR